ncbi:3-isopropylmalate dehydrogenase [candidate division TA06 bacterium]|nr:3-isopropylmalate dehydrogenase [candidate division TA06 bacterium]
MKRYRIAVFPGDGIGPEVLREGKRVLKKISEAEGFEIEWVEYPFGTEHYLSTGETMPESVFGELREMDAIYLGAIGDPRVEVGLLERAIVGGIRFKLDLFINLRPVKLYAEHLSPLKGKGPRDIDFVVVRENTEDLYAGIGGFLKKGTPEEVAIQEMIFTRKGVERAVRYAYDLARSRRKHLTLVDKANAVVAMDIWTRTFQEVGEEYPDVEQDHAYVDAAVMWMVKNPEKYDVIVVSNMFGDILTDLGAALQGGMGIAASGNLHPGRVSMFEPIHGSAPKHAGKNTACPLGAISAAMLLLVHLGENKGACKIEKAMEGLLLRKEIPSLSTDSGLKTRETGDLLIRELSE